MSQTGRVTPVLRPRILAALLLAATALTGCGRDADDRAPAADNPTMATEAADVSPEATPPAVPSSDVASPAPSAGAPSSPPPPSSAPTPSAGNRTPPFVLPTRSAGAPGARQVVDAFRAAGLPVTGVRDRSVDCGPDGAGVGCAELIVTDAVAVYVFPDEASAADRADVWGSDAHRRGTVVLNYLGTGTSTSQRQRYATVLAELG